MNLSGSSKVLIQDAPNWLGVLSFGKNGLIVDLTSQCEIPLYGLEADGRVKVVRTLEVTGKRTVYMR